MTEQPPRSDSSDRIPTSPRDLYSTSDIRIVMLELGRLTERVDGLRESGKGTNHLQIAAIVVVILLAAFGAWGFNAQLTALNAKIDHVEEQLGNKLDRLEDHTTALRDRVVKLEPRR